LAVQIVDSHGVLQDQYLAPAEKVKSYSYTESMRKLRDIRAISVQVINDSQKDEKSESATVETGVVSDEISVTKKSNKRSK
jgi:hypothetical protein